MDVDRSQPGPVESGDGPPEDPTWNRLQSQLAWYSSQSRYAQRQYKALKVVELVVAALLPVVAGVGAPALVTGSLGATVVVLESVQHLFQYQATWILYRSTAEALKREHYLYLAGAGPYSGDNRRLVLAERVEALASQEHARWAESHHLQADARPAARQRQQE